MDNTQGPRSFKVRGADFSQVRFSGLQQEIYETLRHAIVHAYLAPGARLLELDLAAQFHVSQTPVREALGRLVQEGLAVNIPRRGTFVTRPTAEEAEDVYSLRAEIERWAVARFIARAPSGQVDDLRRCVADMDAAEHLGDYEGAIAADMRFHEILCQGSGSPLLARIWSFVDTRVRGIRALAITELGRDVSDFAASHQPIIDAIERRDSEAAQEAVARHCFEAWQDLREILDALGRIDDDTSGTGERSVTWPNRDAE